MSARAPSVERPPVARARRGGVLRPLILGITVILVPTVLSGLVMKATGQSLLRNLSPSVPMGFYSARLGDVPRVRVGEYVCLLGSASGAPRALREAIAQGLVPSRWQSEPLLKLVAAVEGDRITYEHDQVHVNGVALARSVARTVDADGHALPRPPYPLVLERGTVWLASTHERGFDSRYFGPVALSALSCMAKPLWTE